MPSNPDLAPIAPEPDPPSTPSPAWGDLAPPDSLTRLSVFLGELDRRRPAPVSVLPAAAGMPGQSGMMATQFAARMTGQHAPAGQYFGQDTNVSLAGPNPLPLLLARTQPPLTEEGVFLPIGLLPPGGTISDVLRWLSLWSEARSAPGAPLAVAPPYSPAPPMVYAQLQPAGGREGLPYAGGSPYGAPEFEPRAQYGPAPMRPAPGNAFGASPNLSEERALAPGAPSTSARRGAPAAPGPRGQSASDSPDPVQTAGGPVTEKDAPKRRIPLREAGAEEGSPEAAPAAGPVESPLAPRLSMQVISRALLRTNLIAGVGTLGFLRGQAVAENAGGGFTSPTDIFPSGNPASPLANFLPPSPNSPMASFGGAFAPPRPPGLSFGGFEPGSSSNSSPGLFGPPADSPYAAAREALSMTPGRPAIPLVSYLGVAPPAPEPQPEPTRDYDPNVRPEGPMSAFAPPDIGGPGASLMPVSRLQGVGQYVGPNAAFTPFSSRSFAAEAPTEPPSFGGSSRAEPIGFGVPSRAESVGGGTWPPADGIRGSASPQGDAIDGGASPQGDAIDGGASPRADSMIPADMLTNLAHWRSSSPQSEAEGAQVVADGIGSLSGSDGQPAGQRSRSPIVANRPDVRSANVESQSFPGGQSGQPAATSPMAGGRGRTPNSAATREGFTGGLASIAAVAAIRALSASRFRGTTIAQGGPPREAAADSGELPVADSAASSRPSGMRPPDRETNVSGPRPVGSDQMLSPLMGQVTMIAPPLNVASAESEQGGAAVQMDWATLAGGASSLDSAGFSALSAMLPGAQAIYPALPAGAAGPGAVNLSMAPSLARDVLTRGYGATAGGMANEAASRAKTSNGPPSSAMALQAKIVPTDRTPTGQGASPTGDASKAGSHPAGALADAGSGAAKRGGALDFLGMPVRLAPSLSGKPELAQQTSARNAAASMAAKPATVRPNDFAPLQKRMLPSVQSLETEPDKAKWAKAAPAFGLPGGDPLAVLAPTSRVGGSVSRTRSSVFSGTPGALVGRGPNTTGRSATSPISPGAVHGLAKIGLPRGLGGMLGHVAAHPAHGPLSGSPGIAHGPAAGALGGALPGLTGPGLPGHIGSHLAMPIGSSRAHIGGLASTPAIPPVSGRNVASHGFLPAAGMAGHPILAGRPAWPAHGFHGGYSALNRGAGSSHVHAHLPIGFHPPGPPGRSPVIGPVGKPSYRRMVVPMLEPSIYPGHAPVSPIGHSDFSTPSVGHRPTVAGHAVGKGWGGLAMPGGLGIPPPVYAERPLMSQLCLPTVRRSAPEPALALQRSERGGGQPAGDAAKNSGGAGAATVAGAGRGPENGMAANEVHLLANEVYSLLKRRFTAESERRGRW